MAVGVSVVVPAHDVGPWVERAVRSVVAQTLTEVEVVAVENGSSDDTAARLAGLAGEDSRVRLLRAPRPLGAGAARNLGLEAARGEWVGFLDADDRYHPDRLRQLLGAAEREDAAIVADNQRLVRPDGSAQGLMWPERTAPERIDAAAFVRANRWGEGGFGLGYAKPLIRRDRLEHPRLHYDPRLRVAEDFHFLLDLLMRGETLLLLPQAFYDYSLRPASLSRSLARADLEAMVRAALAAEALGPRRVLALLMPERESPRDALDRALALCRQLGVPHEVEDVTAPLEAAGCYRRRDDAIRRLFPDFGAGWRQKIVLAGNPAEAERLSRFDLVVEGPDGVQRRARMPAEVYLQVVAATNMKQRIRKLMEYHHAERRNHAVLGTPNRLEYELGFFVRGGDGLADIKPIAHLYKTQVYALAAHLGVPEDIRARPPSTDTYSLDQTQQEFYFGLPWQAVDRLLWALNRGLPAETAGRPLGLSAEQARRAWKDIHRKRAAARRNLAEAVLVDPVDLEPAES